jgi:ATP-dependent Zn protease
MCTALAGRLAEELVYGVDDVETGAASDLKKVMNLARNYVLRWGFSDNVCRE